MINLGFLFIINFSASFSIFLSSFFAGSIPGLITVILSEFTPQLTAKSFVYLEFETILSALFNTFKILLFKNVPLL